MIILLTLFAFYCDVAKEKCDSIDAIRVEMDLINDQILELIAKRTAYVKRAGDLKSKTTRIADDRRRVADQEKNVIQKSIELGLPLEISLPVFQVLMESSIKYQQEYINDQ